MPHCELIAANPNSHRSDLIELNVEYVSWVLEGLEQAFGVPANEVIGMPASQYVPTVIDKVCGDTPPKGVFYLLMVDGSIAGMGGMRFLRDGVAEIKRIYVRAEYRGMNLGKLLLDRLLADAASFGYQRVCLDSAMFMQSAQRLYRASGFIDCAAYEGVEVPAEYHSQWCFMERAL